MVHYPFQEKYPHKKKLFLDYIKGNEKFLSNPLVQSFLEHPETYRLFVKSVIFSNPVYKAEINSSFRQFFVKVRFLAYVSKLIRYYCINYDRKQKLECLRCLLTLDKPLSVEEEGETLVDILEGKSLEEPFLENTVEGLTDKRLYFAFQKLTGKQKEVLHLSYVYEMKENEIASIKKISQQAVSRIKQRALSKLRASIGGV
ncbi:sigma-70 family RNA polymerase sigma factor [Pseudalkalibacillus caeni]|uniref:Sigma-70 family RNA polymerase sigma factor n=1 Tax=Exobacillus caeni TaxID=2574798 RepID=A0A5R9EZC0_9BACL|nr:sigma-70 family RNA polymerase sigma factor [Pseudalkalibacillus caeni]TLS36652.1 sigma-70 family RNA polymerase sigma factor [Pseudalkalibacillus caeni]